MIARSGASNITSITAPAPAATSSFSRPSTSSRLGGVQNTLGTNMLVFERVSIVLAVHDTARAPYLVCAESFAPRSVSMPRGRAPETQKHRVIAAEVVNSAGWSAPGATYTEFDPPRESFPTTYHGTEAPPRRARCPHVYLARPPCLPTASPLSTETNEPDAPREESSPRLSPREESTRISPSAGRYSWMKSPKSRLRPMKHIPALLRRRVTAAGRFAGPAASSRTSRFVKPPRGKHACSRDSPLTDARK